MSSDPHSKGDAPRTARDLFAKKSTAKQSTQTAPSGSVTVPPSPARADAYVRRAFTDELATLSRTPEGERNGQLNVSAFNLSQFVAGGHLDHNDVWNALHDMALSIGLTEAETNKTLASGFEAGMAAPRDIPDDDAPPLVTVLHFPEVADDDTSAVDKLFPVIDWHDLWADKTEDEWVLYPLIPARRLVAVFSAPKVGKSLLMLELAVAVSRGADVLGERVDRPRTVLYVDYENDPRGDVRSRLQAMGYGPDDLANLKMVSFPQLAFLDTPMGGLQLLALAQRHGADIVIIDTISRAVGGEENANDTWLGFYKHSGLLLKAAGIACIRLDHTGKDESKGMRGGSAKYGDVDAVWAMTRVTDDTYQLECTANRLPIAEKTLVLRRETEPVLRHMVEGSGLRAKYDAHRRDLIRVLDLSPAGDGPIGAREARRIWKAAGVKGVQNGDPLRRLLDERERMHSRPPRPRGSDD